MLLENRKFVFMPRCQFAFFCVVSIACTHLRALTQLLSAGRSMHCSVTRDRHCKTSKACFHLFLVPKEVGGRLSPSWPVKLTGNVSEIILIMLGVGKWSEAANIGSLFDESLTENK